ncbi:MAG: Phosphoribosylglycinamide formyltransferase [Methanobacteriota archaeon]|nr:MAG: Phosphoribosylglycinamide formyltransferase [Euryarchaeota archaeon]
MNNFQLPRLGTIKNPLRIAILISGSGSGMEALINYQFQKQNCFHKTTLVISNKANAKGIQIAESKKIQTSIIELPKEVGKNKLRESHENLIQSELEKFDVEVVVLSGYMRILSPTFVKKWMGRLLNIHPSLLPNFPGAHAHEEVLAAGVKESGCTVHFVDIGVDTGPIIAQEIVKVYSEDTLEDLQNRVKEKEHKIYPKVLDALSEGRIEINSIGHVIIHNL